ncbi:MAG: hypothetical protein HUU22_05620 [Phycisphaerae bacterium]|nr:hypothetical protein [Phycisphaerae bacterium]NUQ45491.1 hypothetical protein [Phycisphaerae bacterium]
MYLRYTLLLLSIPMMICGALSATLGPSSVPLEFRQVFFITWAIAHPAVAFFGAAFVLVVALLMRTGRTVLVNDFAH